MVITYESHAIKCYVDYRNPECHIFQVLCAIVIVNLLDDGDGSDRLLDRDLGPPSQLPYPRSGGMAVRLAS